MNTRMCCACRTRKSADELIRVARESGGYSIDPERKIQGRGAHVCRDKSCIEKCVKTRALNRSFKTAVPNDVYSVLSTIYQN